MMNKNLLAIFSALSFCVSGMSMAAVDCSNAANQHKDECVRAKVNVQNNNVVDCSNAANQHKDECVRAKINVQNNNVVDCSNAANQHKDECVRAKINVQNNSVVDCSNAANQHKDEPDYHRDSASFNRRCGIGAVRQPILTSSIIINSRLNR